MSFLLEMRMMGENLEVDPENLSFIYDEVVQGASTFQIHAASGDWEKWDRTVKTPEPQNVALRWGDLVGDAERWATWKEVQLSYIKFRYSASTVELWIQGVDSGFVLNEKAHGLAFVDQTVSQAVTRIARVNGFRSTHIVATKGEYTLYQGTLTDAQFILNVLLPLAESGAGRTDYSFYFEDGKTLVFAPLSLDKVAATYKANPDPTEGGADDIQLQEVEYRRLFRSQEGSYATQFRGFDSLRKEPLFSVVNDTTADFSYLARNKPVTPAVPAQVTLVPGHTSADVTNYGRAEWGVNARGLFRTSLDIAYEPHARAGTVIDLAVRDPDSRVHWSSGRWFVYKVRQWFRPKGEGTILYLERRAYE